MNEGSASTILIIDDNTANLAIAAEFLEKNGFTVLMAQDGESGLRWAKYAHPNLILLDVILPGLDGFKTCHLLKSDQQTQDIPVIFMTGLSNMEDKVRGFEVGGVDYITKPMHGDELLIRITTHLRIQALTQQLQQQNQRLQQQTLELKAAKEAAETANRELERLVNLDSVTQIANRRHFDRHLQQEWQRLIREQYPLSLILADIDYFKAFNDYYGHQAGDDCLRKIAQVIKSVAKRPTDLVSRYGGEEFAIILPNTNLEGAIRVTELIQLAIEKSKVPHAKSKVSSFITVSFGITSQVPHPELLPKDLVANADKALYGAKEQGRNCYCIYVN
jgi:diguanylate cyclase (GGDEF)-like protein